MSEDSNRKPPELVIEAKAKNPYLAEGEGIVDKQALDSLIMERVMETIRAGGNGGKENQLLLLSGGSASNVGEGGVLAEKLGVTHSNSTLKLDSEAILNYKYYINNGINGNGKEKEANIRRIMPAMNEIEKMGYKHAEKFPRYRQVFREVLKYATEKYYWEIEEYNRENKTDIKGSVVIDDHFEKVTTEQEIGAAQKLAKIAKEGYNATVGYIGFYVDPRVALARAAVRSANGKDVVAPAFQIGTYINLPKNWDDLCADKNVDVTMLVHNNREQSMQPRVVARKVGDKEIEVLDPLEYYCFRALSSIKKGVRRASEIFQGKDGKERNLDIEFIEQEKKHPDGTLAKFLAEGNAKSFVERVLQGIGILDEPNVVAR